MKKGMLLPVCLCMAGQVLAQEKELSAVVVTGNGSDIEERRLSATQKVIVDRQAIEATGGLYVGEVLSKLPGVEAGVPSSDGSVSLRSRGMVRDSVQVLVDGERPPGDARHAMLIVARMPAGELERVEIMKGATAEFGSSTPVTINLVTNKARRDTALGFKLAAGVRDSDPLLQASLTRTGSEGNWSWSIPLNVGRWSAPVDRELRRREATAGVNTLLQDEREKGHNEVSELFFGPKLNWKEGSSNFSIWPMLMLANGERKTQLERIGYADPVNATGAATILTRRDREESQRASGRLRVEGETLYAGSKFSGRLTLVSSEQDKDTNRDGSGGFFQEKNRRSEREVNAALRADHGWGDHVSAVGIEHIRYARRERQDYTGGFVYNDVFRAREVQDVAWLQDEWSLTDKFALTGGLRGESIYLQADNVSSTHDHLAPSLALRWEFNEGWLFRSSLGTAIKVPKLEEISNAPIRSTTANSPLEPDRRGNPNLRPETSATFDLALEHYWPNELAVVGVNAYLRRTSDFIERRFALETGRWVERPYNEGDARHWGVEIDAKIKTEGLGYNGGTFRSHLTLPHAMVDDQRLGITRAAREVPRYVFSFGYDQTIASLASNAGFLVQATGATRTDVANEQWGNTRARTVVDAYWVKKIDRSVNLRLTLQNILGTDTRKTVRAYSGGQEWELGSVDAVPRVAMLTLEGKW